MRSMNVILI